MTVRIAKLLDLVALLLAAAWVGRAPDFDSILTALALLSAYIFLEFKDSGRELRLEADRKLFAEFLQALPSQTAIDFLKYLGGTMRAFPRDALHPFDRFFHEWRDAQHTFHDAALDKKRMAFFEAVKELLLFISNETFDVGDGLQGVPNEWRATDHKRYYRVIADLDRLGAKTLEAHQDFVRTAKLQLHV